MADVPFEILELIATYLSSSDVATSCYVCTNWLNPMRNRLYQTVYIETRKRFRRFFRSIQQLDPDGSPYGRRVKSLVLNDRVGMTWVEIEQLALLCPALEILYFHQRIWKYVPRGRQLLNSSNTCADGSVGWQRSMRQLPPINYHAALKLLPVYGVKLTTLHIAISQPTAFSIFANTPHLKELVLLPTILGDDFYNNISEAAHNVISYPLPVHPHHFHSVMGHCPQLEIFKVLCKIELRFELTEEEIQTSSAAAISENQGPSSQSTTHGQLQSLEIAFAKSSINSQYSCIRYISQSFPNLTSLDFNFITINTFIPQQPFRRAVVATTEQRIQTFVNLGLQCQKLEKLRLRGIDALLAPNQQFFEALASVGTRLKVLEMGRVQELSLPGGSAHYLRYNKETYDSMLQAVGSSLVVLHLHTAYWNLPHVSTLVASITRSCPLLKDLKISALAFGRRLRSPVDVDIILSKLVSLELLEINNAHVTCSTSHPNEPTTTTSSVFSSTTSITMPKSKLKSFRLNRVHFTPNLFIFLSHRCPQLSRLSVVCSVQQQPDVSTVVTVWMPHHVFDEINLTEIYLKLESSSVGFATVCSLTQMNKPKWAKRDGRRYGNPSTRWYVNHDRRLRDKQIHRLQKYETKKIESAMDKVDGIDGGKQHGNRLASPSLDEGYRQEWMKHGRLAVECHSVYKFIFNNGCIIP